MFNLCFTPCSTWTGAAVASQPVLSPHTRGVPAPLLLQLAGGWSLASLTPPQGGLLPGDQLFHPTGHRGSRGWTCRTGITLGGLLGVGNPFPCGLSPPRAGSAASAPKPLMQHQSHTVTLPGFSGFPWDQSHGYLAAWAACPGHGDQQGLGCMATAWGRGAAVFIFHLLQGTTGEFFFVVIHFIFSRLCVFFTSQNPSCKHPAVSPGGGRCPASHSAGLSLLPTPSQHRGHRRVPTSPQLCMVLVTWLVTPGTPGIPRNAGDTLAADFCRCQPRAQHPTDKYLPKMAHVVPSEGEEVVPAGGREKGMSWGQWVGIPQENSQPASRGQWNISQRKCGRQRGGEAERRRLEKHQDLGPQWACSKHPTRLSCPMFQAGAPASPDGVCGWINQQSVPGSVQSPVIGIPMSRTP